MIEILISVNKMSFFYLISYYANLLGSMKLS